MTTTKTETPNIDFDFAFIKFPSEICKWWRENSESVPVCTRNQINERLNYLNLQPLKSYDFEIIKEEEEFNASVFAEKIDNYLRLYRWIAYAMTKSKKLKKIFLDKKGISCQEFLNICRFVTSGSELFKPDTFKMIDIILRETKNIYLKLLFEKIKSDLEEDILKEKISEPEFFNQLKSLPKNDALTVLTNIDAEFSIVNLLKQAYLKDDSKLFEKTVIDNKINLAIAYFVIWRWLNIQNLTKILEIIQKFNYLKDGDTIEDSDIKDLWEIVKSFYEEIAKFGYLSKEMYLTFDEFYERFENGTLKITGKIGKEYFSFEAALMDIHFSYKDLSSNRLVVHEMNQLINSSPEYKEIYSKVKEEDFDLFSYFLYDEFNEFANEWLPSKNTDNTDNTENPNQEDTANIPPTSIKFSIILPEWVDKLKKLAELLAKPSPNGHQQYIDQSDVINFYYRIAGRLVEGDHITETNLQKIKWFGHCFSLKFILSEIYKNYGLRVNGEDKRPNKFDHFISDNYKSLKRGKMSDIPYGTIKDNLINEEREQIKSAFQEGEREYLTDLLVKSGIKIPQK